MPLASNSGALMCMSTGSIGAPIITGGTATVARSRICTVGNTMIASNSLRLALDGGSGSNAG